MTKHWYVTPDHFRRQLSSKTKQVKLKTRSLVSADGLLDKKYVRGLTSDGCHKKKAKPEN